MNKRYDQSPRFSAAGVSTSSILALILVLAASVSVPAHAAYRCDSPSRPADARACELARHDAPNDLSHFIYRTSPIYALYFYDYVKEADFDRWEAARRRAAAAHPSPRLTDSMALTKEHSPSKD